MPTWLVLADEHTMGVADVGRDRVEPTRSTGFSAVSA